MNDPIIRILLVDDEPDFLLLMSRTLEREGYEIATCMNGENIGRVIQENPPDMILLDITMENVDGREICRAIKQDPATRHIRVILFSSNHDLAFIAKECGADGSLGKPYDKQMTRQVFQQVLH
ncbi:MAG: response regulator [Chitinophagaceae bacterium]